MPHRVSIPDGVDSFGNICGQDNSVDRAGGSLYGDNAKLDMSNHANLYYVDPSNPDAGILCVTVVLTWA